MSSAPTSAPSKFDFTGSLDILARSAATLLLIMYGGGFVILSAYEAKFGVVQFGPLRARIFLVGFFFTSVAHPRRRELDPGSTNARHAPPPDQSGGPPDRRSPFLCLANRLFESKPHHLRAPPPASSNRPQQHPRHLPGRRRLVQRRIHPKTKPQKQRANRPKIPRQP